MLDQVMSTMRMVEPNKMMHQMLGTDGGNPDTDGDGVLVTESFDSPMLGDPEIYPGKLEGRCDQLRAALTTTLENLKTALES